MRKVGIHFQVFCLCSNPLCWWNDCILSRSKWIKPNFHPRIDHFLPAHIFWRLIYFYSKLLIGFPRSMKGSNCRQFFHLFSSESSLVFLKWPRHGLKYVGELTTHFEALLHLFRRTGADILTRVHIMIPKMWKTLFGNLFLKFTCIQKLSIIQSVLRGFLLHSLFLAPIFCLNSFLSFTDILKQTHTHTPIHTHTNRQTQVQGNPLCIP